MKKLKAPIQCESCEYFAPQPAGYFCSGFTYMKVDGKIIADNRKKRKPKGCPCMEE